ncbi:hypothetical protein BY458DRAFT_499331 [Sporodiniella umbellata]|nr:hypothetical protein BY458DRAFT_499331 [Sporodiniella umbellata]
MNNQTDVFIVGTGLSGLYAALVLSKMNMTVYMIENNQDEYEALFLLSPRILQLLNQQGLLDRILPLGTVHRMLHFYQSGRSVCSHPVFENQNTGFDYSLLIEKEDLYQVLLDRLVQLGISFGKETLIKIEEASDRKLVYLNNKQVWKTRVVLIENDSTNIARQALGINYKYYYFNPRARYFYTMKAKIKATNFPEIQGMCVINREAYALYTLGCDESVYITFEHEPRWKKLSLDKKVPIPLAMDYIKHVFEPYSIELEDVESYTRWKSKVVYVRRTT